MAAKSLTDIGKFYKQVEEFKSKLTQILALFEQKQELIELHKYYDKLILFKQANVRKPIEYFYESYVILYATQILKRDESFFLDKVSEIDLQEKRDLCFISQVRGIWQKLPQHVKECIWDYVQVICILSEKVIGGEILAMTRENMMSEGTLSNK